ncbi:hypothetical protein 015DV004_249 [Bacillus phage 015DV004]|nr:hypothetical protein 015DV004_249 [Bacillus phage 015DV004]
MKYIEFNVKIKVEGAPGLNALVEKHGEEDVLLKAKESVTEFIETMHDASVIDIEAAFKEEGK